MSIGRRSRTFRALFPLFAGAVLLFGNAMPQAFAQLLQGSISGNVSDASQAAVASAKVSATDENTGLTRAAVANSTGVYDIPVLPPGTYKLTINAPGFQTAVRTGVVVAAQTATRVDVMLNVGAVTESVQVAASATSLQTDRMDVRSELGSQQLSNLPVPIGRNYQNIFTTLPGFSPPQNSHSFSANGSRSLMFTVNGGNINSNETRVDGAGTRNFSATDVILYVPNLDSIDTVNVATNSLEADQSAGGAYVNVTVKSGTNALHGSIFETHSNQHLEAYQWAADRTAKKLPFINNQFGASAGGPIRKDRMFFFASYEGVRLVQGNVVNAQVPTAAMKAGNLSASPTNIYDPLSGAANGTGRTPFADKLIPANRIDPGVKAMLDTGAWPNPNQAGSGAFGLSRNFQCLGCQGNSGARRDQIDGKFNWNPNSKLSTYVRAGYNNGDWYNPVIFGLLGGPVVSPTNISAGVGAAKVWNNTVSASYIFSPSLLLDAFFGYSRIDMYSKQPNQEQNLGYTLLKIPGLDTSGLSERKKLEYGGLPLMAIDAFTSLGPANTFQPQEYHDPEKNFTVNLSWLKSTHNIRAGFDADLQDSAETQYQTNSSGNITNAGGFRFAQGTTLLSGGPAGNDFNAFASLLLGLPQDAGKIYQFQDEYFSKTRSFALYIRDRWQITPKLTLTYGVRWEYFPFPTRKGTGTEVFNPATNIMSICGLNGVPSDCGITKDKWRLGPRVGFAYRLRNSTVIRAGYSKTIDPIFFMGFTSLGNRNFPYIYAQVIPTPNSFSYSASLRQGIPVIQAPDLSSGSIPVPNNVAVQTYSNDNYVRGYIQNWNLTLEQRFGKWLASAGYVASRFIDPQNNLQENWSPIGGGSAGQQLTKLTGRTASTQYIGTLGTNTYDGLQTRLVGRYSGYTMNFTYTFSKALGYGINPSINIPDYFRLNRSEQSNSLRHVFSASIVAELPFGKTKRWAKSGVPAAIAGGWQLSTVIYYRSGFPFTATASTTGLNSTFISQFADCTGTPKKLGDIYQWYDRSTFATPASGRFGTCGPNNLFGPTMFNSNVGVERKFKLTERFTAAFRTDMFNLGNTPHHSLGNTSVNSGTFMQALGIINTGLEGIEQRAFRFSLKVSF